MTPAAIGIRAHSGWAAVIAAAGAPGSVEVIHRAKIVITAPKLKGAKQPYHHAATLSLAAAERYLSECAAASGQLAYDALASTIKDAALAGKRITCCAILLASGRSLPALPNILASHALIHTAEGEFFRHSFRTAAERLSLTVTGIPERDLDQCSHAVFGPRAARLQSEVADLGKSLGPPWTSDQKNACLAAFLVLSERSRLL